MPTQVSFLSQFFCGRVHVTEDVNTACFSLFINDGSNQMGPQKLGGKKKGGSQEMAVTNFNGKSFINDSSGEFGAEFRRRTHFSL